MKKILLQELTIEELSALISKNLLSEIKTHLPQNKTEEYFTRKEAANFLKITLPLSTDNWHDR